MIGHYALTLYRSLIRRRLYSAINVVGLAVGVAAFLVLALDVRFETSFERWLPGASRLYVVGTTMRFPGAPVFFNPHTTGALLETLRADYPKVQGAVVSDHDVVVRSRAEATLERLHLVSRGFLDVIRLPLAVRSGVDPLRGPADLLISERRAKRYFGGIDPVGREITLGPSGLAYGGFEEARTYRITGVLKDPPANSDLAFDFVAPLTTQTSTADPKWSNWETVIVTTYLRMDAEAAAALNSRLDGFIDRHAATALKPAHRQIQLRAVRLVDRHLRDPKDAAAVAVLGCVGLSVLLLAALNYVNLATASAGARAREVAIRKVMGATEGALRLQFLAEAVLTAAVATLVGLTLCELTLPIINAAGGLSLRLDYLGRDGLAAPLLALVLAVGVAAGAWPALALARFRPAAVLAASRSPGGGRTGARVREALVTAQFAVAIGFTVATAVILAQARHLRHGDLGFQREALVVVGSFDDGRLTAGQRSTLLRLWRGLPGVGDVTTSNEAPGEAGTVATADYALDGVRRPSVTLHDVSTGAGFLRTYRVRLVAGRELEPSRAADVSAPIPADGPALFTDARPVDALLNVSAARDLGFSDPHAAVGRTVTERDGGLARPVLVVGVVADVRFGSPREPVAPSAYYLHPPGYAGAIAALRYDGATSSSLIAQVGDVWRRIAPAQPFRAATAQTNLSAFYTADEQRARLFSTGAVLADLISGLGLFGLTAFAAERRRREIGIRKALGASTGEVLRLLVGQFLRPVAVANLIAWPAAYLVLEGWLLGFDQRIALTPAPFLGATGLTLLLALATVSGEAWRAAQTAPAKALRHD